MSDLTRSCDLSGHNAKRPKDLNTRDLARASAERPKGLTRERLKVLTHERLKVLTRERPKVMRDLRPSRIERPRAAL